MTTDKELAREFAERLKSTKSRQERQKILDEIKSFLHDKDKETYRVGFVLLLINVLRSILSIGIMPLFDNTGLLTLVSMLLLELKMEKEGRDKVEKSQIKKDKVIKEKTWKEKNDDI